MSSASSPSSSSNNKLKSLTVPRASSSSSSRAYSPASSPGKSRPTSSAPSTPTRTRYKKSSSVSPQTSNNSTSSTVQDACSAREAQHLNTILRNLNFRFKNCTFTYKDAHLKSHNNKTSNNPSSNGTTTKPPKPKSMFRSVKNALRSTMERLSDAVGVTEEVQFNNCIFVPKSKEEDVRHFAHQNFSDIPLRFEMCKFVQRESSLLEQITRRLRRFFGIIFELTEMPNLSIAEVEECTFRLKDVPGISNFIQERIVEKYYSS